MLALGPTLINFLLPWSRARYLARWTEAGSRDWPKLTPGKALRSNWILGRVGARDLRVRRGQQVHEYTRTPARARTARSRCNSITEYN
jgi:hypothetical protein